MRFFKNELSFCERLYLFEPWQYKGQSESAAGCHSFGDGQSIILSCVRLQLHSRLWRSLVTEVTIFRLTLPHPRTRQQRQNGADLRFRNQRFAPTAILVQGEDSWWYIILSGFSTGRSTQRLIDRREEYPGRLRIQQTSD